MLLSFLFLCLMFILIGFIFSKIELEVSGNIDNLLHNENKEILEKKIIDIPKINYQVYIRIYLYRNKYLGFLNLKLNSEYLKIYKYKMSTRKVYLRILKNINLEKMIKTFKLRDLKLLNINIEKIVINGKITTQNDISTMYINTFISILLYNLIGYLSFKVKENIKKVDIKLEPIFNSNNMNLAFKDKLGLINGYMIYEILINLNTTDLIRFVYVTSKNMKNQNA